jgi:hypothetical protein
MERSALISQLKNKIYSPCLCYEGTETCSGIFNNSCCFNKDNSALSVWLVLCPIACVCCLANCLYILHDTSDCLCLPCCCYLKINDKVNSKGYLQKVTYTYCLFGKTTELIGPPKQIINTVYRNEEGNPSAPKYVNVE